jgi:hypothetical protein
MEIKTFGIDLAKNLFQTHGMDERGKRILRKQLKREQVAVFLPSYRPVLSAWKLVVVLTTGPVSLRRWAIPCDCQALCQEQRE